MIIVTTEYTLEKNKLKDFLKTLEDLANFVNAHHTGCHRIDIGFSTEDTTKAILFRVFKSRKHLEKFNNTEKWKELEITKNDLVIYESSQLWEQLSIRPMILSY
jgi:quinol monooxygenase YgiN